jgi:pyroglutamyl-peptidase
MKILITGFEAFDGEEINPSQEILKKINDKFQSVEIIKLVLPTSFEKAPKILEEAVRKNRPDYLISLGQAGGREGISLERVAINLADARICDNDGNRPIDEIIKKDGENAYFSTLPIKYMEEKIKEAGISCHISNTAGTFVCNKVMYQGLYLTKDFPNMSAGFIHLPYLPSQVKGKENTASMSLDLMALGLNTAIAGIIENKKSLK